MDIIGKVYKDYFCDIKKLDGNSHLLNNFNYGGFFKFIRKLGIFRKTILQY